MTFDPKPRIMRQLQAMASPRFDVCLLPDADHLPENKSQWKKDCTPGQVVGLIPWLKAQNAAGWGVYIRPAEGLDRALIVVDDVECWQELTAEHALEPCAVIETSQHNHQLWFDLGPQPMPPAHRTLVSRKLKDMFQGDNAAVGPSRLGRLCTFMNRKPGRADKYGLGPWVILRHSKPGVCSKAAAIRAWAARNAPTLPGTPAHDLAHVQTPKRSPEGKSGAAEAFARALNNARQCERMAADDSVADFAAACSCLRQGYSPADIQAALQATIEASPDRLRKHHNPADYAKRTVRNAAEAVSIASEKKPRRAA